ncbi:hypothetical protein AB0C28_41750 [Nonomuraea sp. NPDC048892]|uniref:hypothetical protein n=1 Tax=Nonomuraea sp. NPDC048892 TaxID=3154624 RepID=UPI0033F39094
MITAARNATFLKRADGHSAAETAELLVSSRCAVPASANEWATGLLLGVFHICDQIRFLSLDSIRMRRHLCSSVMGEMLGIDPPYLL